MEKKKVVSEFELKNILIKIFSIKIDIKLIKWNKYVFVTIESNTLYNKFRCLCVCVFYQQYFCGNGFVIYFIKFEFNTLL